MKRREFLAGLGAGAAGLVSAGNAFAQNPIDAILQSPRRGQWSDEFDAQLSNEQAGNSTIPVFSEQTPGLIELAMDDYRRIAGNGGWPVVPASEKLQLGVTAPAVTE